MNRRGFLSLFSAGAAGFVMDPEMLLWRPGAKTILLPSTVPAFVGNQFITADWFCMETLKMLTRELEMTKHFHHQYGVDVAVGSRIAVRTPRRFQ